VRAKTPHHKTKRKEKKRKNIELNAVFSVNLKTRREKFIFLQ